MFIKKELVTKTNHFTNEDNNESKFAIKPPKLKKKLESKRSSDLDENEKKTESKACTHCKITFKRKCDLLRHVRTIHAKPLKCTTKRRRKKTEVEHKFFCDICNLGYTRRNDMEKHRKNKHPDGAELKPTVKQLAEDKSKKNVVIVEQKRQRRRKSEIVADQSCDICSKSFTRKFDMVRHRSLKHPEAPRLERNVGKNKLLLEKCKIPSDDGHNYYKCEKCAKIFRHSYNFLRHQAIHTELRPFFCHICGKSFRVSGGLQRHINEHHLGVKKYACNVCGKKFAGKSTRDDHQNIHTNTRPFVCDLCGKTFKQKASLHIHKIFHTNVYRFSCSLCGKKFRRANELKVHGYLHSGHKPHKCEVCGAMFRLGQDLKRHRKVHARCVCGRCGRSFGQEKYLKVHEGQCQGVQTIV